MLKLQYFGHLMQRADSLKKTLILRKMEGKRSGQQRIRWLDSITDYLTMNLSQLWEIVKDREAWRPAVHGIAKSRTWFSNWTTGDKLHDKTTAQSIPVILISLTEYSDYIEGLLTTVSLLLEQCLLGTQQMLKNAEGRKSTLEPEVFSVSLTTCITLGYRVLCKTERWVGWYWYDTLYSCIIEIMIW